MSEYISICPNYGFYFIKIFQPVYIIIFYYRKKYYVKAIVHNCDEEVWKN